MKLSQFIEENTEQIIKEWENFARTIPVAKDMNRAALRDHIKAILEFIVRDMETYQTRVEQSDKSKGFGPEEGGKHDSAAQIHADLRSESGFDVAELSAEYRALRASIIKLWIKDWEKIDPVDIFDLIRFNESIDQAGMESIVRYREKIDSFRDMFVGILGQDLLTPLVSISKSSRLLLEKGTLSADQINLASRIGANSERMKTIITDLSELTVINLGTGISITTDIMDMGSVGRQITAEFQATHPNRVISFEATGDLDGLWDHAHIVQVFANLIENAILQGFNDSPITVKASGSRPEEIIISFHYKRPPILTNNLSKIFDRLTVEEQENESRSLRLGLYIAKEIVVAHGGKIDVTSSKEEGTTFTVRLPRTHKKANPFSVAA